MRDEADVLVSDMPFAKVVETPHGECLLIGGRVYQVIGPDGYCADLFSKALRRIGRESGGLEGCANTASTVANA